MLREASERLDVRLEAVDSGGLLPAAATERVFPTAFAFRRFLQGALPEHLAATPDPDPLRRLPPPPRLDLPARFGTGLEIDLSRLPLDHRVAPTLRGGEAEARRRMKEFLRERLSRYDEDRNHPDLEGSSGLSPWLRSGHLSSHEIADALVKEIPRKRRVTGRKEGWWGLSRPAESFLDELVTWRELGINYASKREDYGRFESLPAWARKTLEKHEKDPRPYRYVAEALESAATHDPLWNAAQTQLVREGRLHNYLRMLWGKKILEWTRSPREALEVMIDLNNRYALDGRDPNSYSGIFWVLGRYDRPWGPERPVFGLVRYMSSENTARKLRVSNYVKRYAP
jgi:deoxyribodipyrimidine photo-lyase